MMIFFLIVNVKMFGALNNNKKNPTNSYKLQTVVGEENQK